MQTAKIEALRQVSDLLVSDNAIEIFEKGDRIEVPVELLKKLDPTNWKKLPKNASLIRKPVKYKGFDSRGVLVDFFEEDPKVAKAKRKVFIGEEESVGLADPVESDDA